MRTEKLVAIQVDVANARYYGDVGEKGKVAATRRETKQIEAETVVFEKTRDGEQRQAVQKVRHSNPYDISNQVSTSQNLFAIHSSSQILALTLSETLQKKVAPD